MAGFPDVLSVAHRRVRRRVETWLDGELGPGESRSVRRHLDGCRDCRGDAELLRRIKASLARLDRRRPPTLATVRLRLWAEELAAGHLR
ncbi:MAG: zf-HC2 domain-containing protein [Actinobacteria bacterium]|nr:zf-HC2 domain-containing protein [Actinomycetota bacterium]